ncbi:hypothetical protein J4Z08_23140, partial [Citrobacter portucalensis]|uniref:hypothetical protein n=1 Tax=Citrobacter portucalensis TaxID=1639133 RepID=UPI0031409C07
ERGWKPVSGERPEGFQRKGRDAPQAWLDAKHDSRFPGYAGKRSRTGYKNKKNPPERVKLMQR